MRVLYSLEGKKEEKEEPCTHTHTHTHTRARARAHARTLASTYARTHTHTHTHTTHTHTHTHTHTRQRKANFLSLFFSLFNPPFFHLFSKKRASRILRVRGTEINSRGGKY